MFKMSSTAYKQLMTSSSCTEGREEFICLSVRNKGVNPACQTGKTPIAQRVERLKTAFYSITQAPSTRKKLPGYLEFIYSSST